MPASAMGEGLPVLLTPALLPRLSFADSGHLDAAVIRGPAGIRKCNSKVALIFREASWFSQMAQKGGLPCMPTS